MRVVVTGGAGFIGTHVCQLLTAQGVHVVAYDNLTTGDPDGLVGAAQQLVMGNVLDAEPLAETIKGADAVIHLAALTSVPDSLKNPSLFHQVNAGGTLNVLRAAHATGAHVVLASSAAVYGRQILVPVDELAPLRPTNPYGASKAAAEMYLSAYQAQGLSGVALRMFNVFGPGQCTYPQHAALVPSLCRAALDGKPLPIHGDGSQRRDFVYVGVVASAIACAVVGRVNAVLPINVASGRDASVLDVADAIQTVLGRQLPVEHTPAPRAGDVQLSGGSVDRMRQLLPRVTQMSLGGGLIRTLEWWRDGATTRCGS